MSVRVTETGWNACSVRSIPPQFATVELSENVSYGHRCTVT
jgi:hypothetical protein